MATLACPHDLDPRHERALHKLLDIFVAPRQTFDAIRAHLPVYPPVMVLVGAAVLVSLVYAARVDTQGFVDLLYDEMPEPRPERDLMVSVVNTMVAALPVVAVVYVLITLLAFGVCLWIVGKLVRDGSTFRASMSLACWASMAGAVHSLAAIVAILLAPTDASSFEDVILASATYPLTLGELGVDPTWLGGVPSFFSLTDFWIAALVAIGYQRWYQAHIAQAVAVALVPFALMAVLMLGILSVDGPIASDAPFPPPTASEPPLPTR